jgi:hypothetical protein
MKTLVAVLALQLAAAAQIVGGPVGTGWPMLQFGQPVNGGFLTSITPIHGSTAALCGQSLGLAPVPGPVPGFGGLLYLDLAAPISVEPALLSTSGVEWFYKRTIPPTPAALGIVVATQFAVLVGGSWQLSQGWTTTLQ